MLSRTARLVVRRPLLVLVGALVIVVVCGVVGAGVIDELSPGGFEDPNAESTRAAAQLEERFGVGPPNFVLLVEAQQGTVDDPDVAEAGAALSEDLATRADVREVVSYWLVGRPSTLRSTNGTGALVLARIIGTESEVHERADELVSDFTRSDDTISVSVGGSAAIAREFIETTEEDLRRSERVVMPLTLLLLVVVFGGVVAASLPIAIGIFAVFGALAVLYLISGLTDVSVFALNLVSGLGLGLAIDYSLFTLSRFREELQAGYTTEEAVSRSVQIAGRTVVFSAATLVLALAALSVFPQFFLRSLAYAGAAVVAIAGIGAVVILPAMLRLLGPRVDKLAIVRRIPRSRGEGAWYRLATVIMRRPIPVATLVALFLIMLALPFRNVEFSLPDDRVLPPEAASSQTSEEIRRSFDATGSGALSVIAPDVDDPVALEDDIDRYATDVSALGSVARVEGPTGVYVEGQRVAPPDERAVAFRTTDAFYLSVVPSVEPMSRQGEDLVADVRAQPAPFATLVAGDAAKLTDTKSVIAERLPYGAAIILIGTVVLLFFLFGSVVAPIKAVVLNLLSLTAMFGVIVWVFQEGNLSGLLGFTPSGTVDIANPILMFCLAFGLSMDYEMFILSRMREEYDRTGDHVEAIAVGVQRTAGILTASAGVLAVVFVGFATSGVQLLKMFGVGLAVAVLVDATLVRGALVPAVMRLAGTATWWAPKPLRRLHDRFGITEHVDLAAPPAEEAVPATRTMPAPVGAGETAGVSPADAGASLQAASPRRVADLDVVRSLGRDRHSEVFVAQAPDRLGQLYVAVRVYDDAFTRDEFDIAAAALQAYTSVRSSYLAALYEFGLWQGRLYFTSEYIPLGSLSNPAQPLSTRQMLLALADAARAAHDLHEAGIVQRDLRPRSVLLGPDRAKVAGLGIPQLLADGRRDLRASMVPQTRYGVPAGAVEYIEPAVLTGRPADHASDLWSLGASLHDVLAGASLYGDLPDDPAALFAYVTTTPPQISSSLSADQQQVVRRCIEPDPAHRYSTALELADALDQLAATTDPAG